MAGMLHIAKFTLLEAWRTRFIALIAFCGVAAFGLSLFTGQLAVTETAQTRALLTGAVLRLVWVVALTVFVVASLVREQQDKGIEWYWAMSVGRGQYFFGKFIGYALVAAAACCVSFLALSWTVPAAWLLQWSVILLLEMLVVAGFGMLCALALVQTPAAVVATLGFYALARVIDSIVLLVKSPLLPASGWAGWFDHVVDIIAVILPDLSSFAAADVLAYGPDGGIALGWILGHAALYLMLLLTAGLVDIYRKSL